ncbi:MAG TPA: S-adenosylmethionine:tRNA ribosyltransferase-isomerase [Polyangiaceae bacterium]|nr:S-adenosylmethionine:tRNA ribosyltransferase-isomerase [Polyangiaceae bacterium]
MLAQRETAFVPLAAATAPRAGFQSERLLVIDPLTRRFGDYQIRELPQLLGPGDVLVVNDAATLPASLQVDAELELRLLSAEEDGTFRAIAFGAGDFRDPTEKRAAPRALHAGERLQFGRQLAARVVGVDAHEPRLLQLRFETGGAAFWSALYRHAKPIQYSYTTEPLQLWDVQNRYASRPWAFELPSAGHPLTFEALFEIEKRGATLTHVTHAASISSTGSPELDARLPLAERYEIGDDAARALTNARRHGGRTIAAGTSVVRALEGHADENGAIAAGSGETALRLSGSYEPRVVDGLLTGLHEPGTSHFELLEAFAPKQLLLRALEHAARTGYLQHEFGDSCLVLAGALFARLAA